MNQDLYLGSCSHWTGWRGVGSFPTEFILFHEFLVSDLLVVQIICIHMNHMNTIFVDIILKRTLASVCKSSKLVWLQRRSWDTTRHFGNTWSLIRSGHPGPVGRKVTIIWPDLKRSRNGGTWTNTRSFCWDLRLQKWNTQQKING